MDTQETATVEVTQDERSVAQFFFEMGFGACYAEAMIRNGHTAPFELSDGFLDAQWEISQEAYEDHAELERMLNRTRATRQDGLREALQKARDTIVQHHQWHAAQTDPDPEHGFIPADEYAESSLYERTVATLAEIDPFLRNGPRDTAALPCLVRAALAVQAIRPSNWDDADDPEQLAAWLALDAALSDSSTREESGAGETLEAAIQGLWLDILEKDDRTSPEEYPDMALITEDEFAASIRYAAALAALSASPEGEG